MKKTLGFVKSLVADLFHDAAIPHFKSYAGEGFSLRRSRSCGAETVWFQYEGRGLSVELEGEEGTDGGVLIRLDQSHGVDGLDQATKAQLAANIHIAMQSQGISCQIIEGHRVL